MNSESSKNSKPHLLILNLTDKLDLRRGGQKYFFINLSIY